MIRRSVKYPDSTDSYRIGQRPKVRVSIADYGVGNLHSIHKALEIAGARPVIESNMRNLMDADAIVFPGAGIFNNAMKSLDHYRDIIFDRLNAGTPCLGIGTGAQILFETDEYSGTTGIGLIKGSITQFPIGKNPHMGWNVVKSDNRMFEGVKSPFFYFAHSQYYSPKEDVVIGTTDYMGEFPSVIRKKNVFGTQFYPEKSSASGAMFLRNFVKYLEEKL
ncbi:MAG: imidazole glycerol phosphate synthase subunit HisH [Euryarchaeota archaeon]|nr:imidazole glycerol phosphate synthase subunit HisH [Euryarchaeota archaeon]